MSLSQKAAQLVMVRVFGHYENPGSTTYKELLTEVREREVGGVVVFASEVESVPRLLNDLQEAAEVPLLVSADMERGLSFRVGQGRRAATLAMAIGATRSEAAASFTGEVAAREGRALGVHWAFAPVADVNNNPANPVINIRSFGEEPELVARLGAAFIRGARQGGILTTAKHFPGHGDTAIDSHLALPVLTPIGSGSTPWSCAVSTGGRGRRRLGDAGPHRRAGGRSLRAPRRRCQRQSPRSCCAASSVSAA